MEINNRLFTLLEQKKITKADLARHLGINKTVVSSWSSRGTNPPIEFTVQICELLGVSIEYYITGKNEVTNKITSEEKEMLDLFRKLPEKERMREIGRLEEKAEQYSNQQEISSSSRTG